MWEWRTRSFRLSATTASSPSSTTLVTSWGEALRRYSNNQGPPHRPLRPPTALGHVPPPPSPPHLVDLLLPPRSMEQPDNRLSITDCTEAIYKCKASSVAYLRNHYLPVKPTGRRPSPSTARPAATHEEWFSRKPGAQLVRGDRTRNRILDLLRASGQLREPPNLPNLAQELVSAQLQAKRSGRTAYISPGLLAAPDLSAEYVLNGFAAPGVRWANFSPFLLAVEYLGAEQCWRLAVIDLKSTESLEQAEQVRSSVFPFFLSPSQRSSLLHPPSKPSSFSSSDPPRSSRSSPTVSSSTGSSNPSNSPPTRTATPSCCASQSPAQPDSSSTPAASRARVTPETACSTGRSLRATSRQGCGSLRCRTTRIRRS